MSIERTDCPVDGCDAYWDREVGLSAETPPLIWHHSDTVQDAVRRTVMAETAKRETVLREHLESHAVLDFVRTISRLQRDLAASGAVDTEAERAEKLRGGIALAEEMAAEFGPVTDEERADLLRHWPLDEP